MSKSRITIAFFIGILLLITKFWLLSPHQSDLIDSTAAVEFSDSIQVGAWIWEPVTTLDETRRNQLLDFSQQQKINTLYLTLDDYLDIYELPDSPNRTAQLQNFTSAVQSFISAAHQRHIQVHGLGGQPTWGTADYHYLPQLLLEYVLAYNAQNPDYPFDGLQYDIEFYNLKEFSANQNLYSQEYLSLVNNLTNKVATTSPQLSLGFATPYWFDNQNGNLSSITWKQKTQPIGYHLLDLLNLISGSYVIMAYRDTPTGDNGSIAVSQQEINYATRSAPQAKIVIALETDNTSETKISYYGTSKTTVKQAANTIADHYLDSPVFTGVAIHHLLSYQKLAD